MNLPIHWIIYIYTYCHIVSYVIVVVNDEWGNEWNDMNDMIEMKEQNLAPFFGKVILFSLCLWHNMILFVYFERHNCSNTFIQPNPYQTDHAHLPTNVSIPRKNRSRDATWSISRNAFGGLVEISFGPFFDWNLESVCVCVSPPMVFHLVRW